MERLRRLPGRHRSPAHHAHAVRRRPQALAADRTRSPYRLDLDGTWKFAYADRPEDRDPDFHRTDTDDRDWDTIPVPSVWQLHGHDFPIYLNITYPYWGPNGQGEEPQPPAAPTRYNPVGQYRRTFTVPRDWRGRRVFLHFEGVKSAHYVWINGELAGYDEDSYTPSEYDVTDHLRPGTNQIAVEVYRYSDGDWLEDQDMIRLSGIFRSVFLYSTPPVHLRDFKLETPLDDTYTSAGLDVTAHVRAYGDGGRAAAGTPSRRSCTTPAGTPCGPGRCGRPPTSARSTPAGTSPYARPGPCPAPGCGRPRTRTSTRPSSSSATRPARSSRPSPTAWASGEFALKDGLMRINGRPVSFRGTNRHEMHPARGTAPSPARTWSGTSPSSSA